MQAPCRIGDIESGHVFLPFHYGYFDNAAGRHRAANELTITDWDPVSKQPFFKFAAVKMKKVSAAPVLTQTKFLAHDLGELGAHFVKNVVSISKEAVIPPKPGLHVPHYLGLLLSSKKRLAKHYAFLAARHENEPAILDGCTLFAKWSAAHVRDLEKLPERYGSASVADAKEPDSFSGTRPGGLGLLRDLHDLWLMVNDAHLSITILVQAARALRDNKMAATLIEIGLETDRQIAWIDTHIKTIAPQALVVPAL